MWYVIYSDELYHHGIKGQKWGVRRFQHDDGSVTPAGAERYYVGGKKVMDSVGSTDKTQKKKSKEATKKNLKKAAVVAGTVAAVAAATTVGVLAAKSYSKEKQYLTDSLQKHGKELIKSSTELSKKLSEFEYDPKYRSVSSKDLQNKVNNAIREDLKRVENSRNSVRSSSKSKLAKHSNDNSFDSLAVTAYQGKIGNKDVVNLMARETYDNGKQFVKKILNVT